MYLVYILSCVDGSLYTGITTDVERRLAEHNNGTGGNYTRAKRPLRVVYTERHPNRSLASKREAAIKRLSRKAKLELVRTVGREPRRIAGLRKAKPMV
jgi:putative endonuclease